jgi:hypothetical protein
LASGRRVTVADCAGCDGPGFHLASCPYWQSLPALVTKIGDVLPELAGAPPADVAAFMLMNPRRDLLDKTIHFDRVVPAECKGGKIVLSIPGGAPVLNRLAPELLIALLVNIVATSTTAAEAVARIKLEVDGWKFERSQEDAR